MNAYGENKQWSKRPLKVAAAKEASNSSGSFLDNFTNKYEPLVKVNAFCSCFVLYGSIKELRGFMGWKTGKIHTFSQNHFILARRCSFVSFRDTWLPHFPRDSLSAAVFTVVTLRSLYSSVNGERYAMVHCKTSISTDVAIYYVRIKILNGEQGFWRCVKRCFCRLCRSFVEFHRSFVPFLFSHGGHVGLILR